MNGKTKKNLKSVVCAGMVGLAVLAGTREVRAELIFENIPVTTAPGDQFAPAIWGNYIVWDGAENEAYDITQGQIVQMPGLNIDGVPAIWENKVVYEGANGYYDIDLQQMVYPVGLSVGEWPTIHDDKIVWEDSTGYYELSSGQMIYPPGLSVGDDPDIFGDKIVWSDSTGYYDIGLQQMVYPEGLHIGWGTAIYDNKITWSQLVGMYYDIESQQYFGGGMMVGVGPDIFEDRIVWHNYCGVPSCTFDIFIWDPVCKTRKVTESGEAVGAKIYNDIVVWMDWRNGNGDIYMARIVGCCAAGGQIIYVDVDAPGVNDGSSWTDAYNYLQDALAVALSGDEIWVAEGIYKPDQGVGITLGDRTATFQLINGVAIRGGYAGFGEPDPNARDIDTYETILSGDLNGDDGPDFANNDENNYHVVTSIKTDETTILDGFTIVGGNTHPSDVLYPQNSGGGMYNESGSPTLINCTFKENHSYYLGGGLCNDSGSPRLINCGFVGNLAKEYSSRAFPAEGGAIYNRHGSPTITNCTFTGNWASYWGGGMTTEGGNPRLANCTFAGNYAYNRGGAIAVGPDTSLTLTNCTFGGNLSTHGHVLSCYSWFQQPVSSVRITNCILWNGGKEIASCEDWTVTISYSDVYGGRPGKGNVDVDPCFAGPGYWEDPCNTPAHLWDDLWVDGDYHLLEASPCIDAGDPNYVAEPNETDLDGKPRVIGGRIDMGAYEYSPLIPAEVRIVPRTLNLTSRGKWITSLFWLPEDYDVADIDPNSVVLEGEIEPEWFSVYEQQQIVIVRFSRSEVQGILAPGEVELTVSGELTDGTVFEGTDVIRVIDKGKKK